MKLSLNWLKSYFVDTLDWDKVWERLTLAGIEIEEINSVGADFTNVVVARVVDCVPHPDADKLKVCTVDAGDSESYQIICGAANVTTGVVVPCAKIGATLPGGLTILERKMRGLTSFGMLCAGDEIGIPDTADGLLLLPPEAPIGMSLREYFDLDDKIVEFKITPNRGDCLSIKGLVREIAVLMKCKTKPIVKDCVIHSCCNDKIDIENIAVNIAPNYATIVIKNVNNNIKLPLEITNNLERSGIRSISPIVDLTNYVMLLTGQPLHAFDLDKVGHKLTVRYAHKSEQIKLLNDTTVTLNEKTLVIADSKNQPQAIAGVMGGHESGVSLDTTNIVVECAFFVPEAIQGIAKCYGAFSESATRFERGVDYNMQQDVITYVASLIQQYCGGEIGVINYNQGNTSLNKVNSIEVALTKITQFIGTEIAAAEIINILTALEFNPAINNNVLHVTVPSYRFDINIKEDIIEEVARIYGYDNIPVILPTVKVNFTDTNSIANAGCKIKTFMLNHGFSEIISYAFVEEKTENLFGNPKVDAVKIQNSIANLDVMRTSLIADLIKTLKHNLNYGHHDIRVFELGRIFLGETIDKQPLNLAGLIYGNNMVANGVNKPQTVDFYDLKKVVEELLVSVPLIKFVACDDYSVLHSGRCAKIYAGNDEIGIIGQLHPKLCQELSLVGGPYIFELNVDKLAKADSFAIKDIRKYPRVERDIAFVVSHNIQVGEIVMRINNSSMSDYMIDCHVFDVYQKSGEETKSVAINFVFQGDKTLTDDEIKQDTDAITKFVCENFNASIRA